MTRDEFIAAYCKRSKVSPEWLMKKRVALPCACGDESCEGWAMVSNDPGMIAIHKQLYSPTPAPPPPQPPEP